MHKLVVEQPSEEGCTIEEVEHTMVEAALEVHILVEAMIKVEPLNSILGAHLVGEVIQLEDLAEVVRRVDLACD